MGEEPRFTGWDPWLITENKFTSLQQPCTKIHLLNLYYLSLPRIHLVLPKGPHSIWNFKPSMPHPFRELKPRKDSKPPAQRTPKSLTSKEWR